ncbi:MAG: polyketide synthase, partial [Candidatus Aminicenantes bacterium]
MIEKQPDNQPTGLEIAVIGMAGRFPGAKNIREFWKNLSAGSEAITFFAEEELDDPEVAREMWSNPSYIKAYGWLAGIESFDSSFFGYTPLESELMDPQTRLFHECAFEALESAGYDSNSYNGLIGLYAGASGCFLWEIRPVISGRDRILGTFPAEQLWDKDYLATRVAHKLNLKGPAVTLDTACSTSLVLIHLACQGLLSGDCDIAL